MRLHTLLLLFLLGTVHSLSAQITQELLDAIPTIQSNQDYDYKDLKETSDKLQKMVALSDGDEKEETFQTIARIQLGDTNYLFTFSDYYEQGSDYHQNIYMRSYNPQSLALYQQDPIWISPFLFAHNAEFTEIKSILRFENGEVIIQNKTESIKLTERRKLNDVHNSDEELLINFDELPNLPLDEEIDLKRAVELMNTTKAETFCQVDGYCHYNIIGKVQTKKNVHVFLSFNRDLNDGYSYDLDLYQITLKGKNLKGWISPSSWYPYNYRLSDVDSFRVTGDGKTLIIKSKSEEKREKL